MKFSEEDVKNLNREFERSSPEDILAWASANLGRSVALATSFQVQGMVLVDMFAKANPEARIFTLDTGRLHSHTYDAMEKTREKYGINIEVLFPDRDEVEEMVTSRGVNLFYKSVENRRLCCQVRKTNPLNGYLKTLDAWITSIRADQTAQRAESSKFEIDYLHGRMLKINPMLDWTTEQGMGLCKEKRCSLQQASRHGISKHRMRSLHKGPSRRGEDPRAGRWWWEQGSDKECGIHFSHEPRS